MKVNIKVDANSLAMLKKKIKQLEDLSTKELSNELGKSALDMVNDMQVNVVKDNGDLARSIVAERLNEKNLRVVAKASYAPYVEFGTGKKVNLKWLNLAGFKNKYAEKFQGRGIKEINLPARPYFFPAVRKEKYKLITRLDNKIKKLTK